MEYSNPKIPEDINVSKTHPLSEFALLTLGVFGTLIVIVLLLSLLVDKFAHHIPFKYETNLHIALPVEKYADTELRSYLQELADKLALAVAEELPEDMRIKVDIIDDKTINAFAGLGGQIVFYTGLLKKIPNENALAMVMAHEIAHIKHRHPIRSVGRGVVLGLIVAIFSNSLGNDIVTSSISDVGLLSQLKFSRDNEREADATALSALNDIYGHLNGAEDLFEILKKQGSKDFMPEFFSTHPDTENRIARISEQKKLHTNNKDDMAVTKLPGDFQAWL